jgi:hypothetical protein
VREDQIVPHLAAIGILLASPPGTPARENRTLAQVTDPATTAAVIDQLRADGVVLTYDPQGRTLRAGGHDALSVTIGKHHDSGTRERRPAQREEGKREHPPRPEAERG